MIIPVDFGQVTFVFAGSGVPTGAVTTHGFHNPTGKTAGFCASQFSSWFRTHIMPNLVQNVDLVRTIVKLGPNDVGPIGIDTTVQGGGILTAQSAPQVAFLIRKVTGLGGRRNRGRMYLPAVAEADVTQAGLISSGVVTALNADFAAYWTAADVGDLTPAILHSNAQVPTPITAFVCDATAATQRRRLRR